MKDMSVRTTAALQAWFVSMQEREDGATAAEYALLVALIAVAIIVAVRFLGTSISGIFNKTGAALSDASS